MLSRLLVQLAPRLLAAALVAAVASPLVPSAPAGAATDAGTILYVKGYDVYVARSDGTDARRLTTSGTAASPWVSPDGADDGTVVAARGPVVYRMDQWGTVLNKFDPPDGTDTAGDPIGGTVTHVAISPDGSKVAYTYEHYTCPPRLSCKTRWLTSISAADHLTSPQQYGPSPYDNPTWISDRRLLLNGRDADGIVVFDIGVKNSFWFNDGDGTGYYTGPVTEPALSRDGRVFAAAYDDLVVTYAMNGDVRSGNPPQTPTPTCGISGAADLPGPTVAPDASALAWEEADGVWAKAAPLDCEVQPALLIPGARQPAWSAAALQTTRPEARFSLVRKPDVTGRAVPGKVLTADPGVWSPLPSRVAYQWLRDGRPVAKATRSSYRLARADRAHRISVRVTVRSDGFRPASATSAAVRVR
ncbi:MAG TPA: hypothetical protein VD864_10415 [Nocardioides sp.]|nr:hypothetical protein [Nocardioides sp.]